MGLSADCNDVVPRIEVGIARVNDRARRPHQDIPAKMCNITLGNERQWR